MITVALSTIPPRFATLAPQLAALLAQGPARICLTIPYRYVRFPAWDGQLPLVPAGVEILRAPDRGPATKFLAAFAEAPDADVLICDDDCLYGAGWISAFRSARQCHPQAAIAASCFDTARLGLPRGHSIVQGFAGVMLRPCWLGARVPDPPDSACWVDDIWLSGLLAAAGIAVADCPGARAHVDPRPAPAALQNARLNGLTRADLNRRVAMQLSHDLGIWTHPA